MRNGTKIKVKASRTNIYILQLMMGLLYDTHTNVIMMAVNFKGNNNIIMPWP